MEIEFSAKSIFFTVVISAIAVCLALAVYNRPSEKILKLTALAEQGNADAQYELGNVYFMAQAGASQNYLEAMKWYHKSAEQGNGQAQNMLGELYENGLGAPKDLVQAYMWYSLAMVQDNKYAKFRNMLEKVMSPEQVAEAQRLTREWMQQHPK